MVSPVSSLRYLIIAGLALGGSMRAATQLSSVSPFNSPQATVAGPTQGAPLEYRGYMVTPEGTLYRIVDPAKKTGTFLKLNERDPNFDVIIKQFDSNNDMVTVEHGGRTLTLEERKAKIVSSGNAAAMPPPVPAQQPNINVAPAVTQSVVLNPTPADEQRRLDAVAQEVARRRALREQAQQTISQGGTPQVAIPAPQPQVQQPRNFQQAPQGVNVSGQRGNNNSTTNRRDQGRQQR
jgi:hypothetical protein